MRHKLALLVLLSGALTLAACGDDNDTAVPTPTVTNTVPSVAPTSTRTQAPPTFTNTPVFTDTPGGSPTATPSTTPTGGITEPPDAFSCEFRTSYNCQGGARDGQVCRPARPTPEPDDLCPGGTCAETEFFCKGGPMENTPCLRPNARTPVAMRTPEPCPSGRCQNSELQICTQGTCPIVARSLGGGKIDVECNSSGECSAVLDNFDPVNIPGIGEVCVKPQPQLECPLGRIECAGGAGLDYDLLQVHTIGACGVPNDPTDNTGNGQCETMCQAFCDARDSEMIDFGCAGYCKAGGLNNELKDLYCRCDSPTQTCTGTAHCSPMGSCNGKDLRDSEVNNPDALKNRNVCGCQCIKQGGAASRAGAVNFQVAAQIIVEVGPPCDQGAVLLTLAPQCIPLTTETSSGVLTNANNNRNCPNDEPGPGCAQIPDQGKLVRTGVPVPCSSLPDVSEMNIVGNISFFDSTIGDIETVLDWTCR